MATLERIVTFLFAQYRWGLHPVKLVVALLLPVVLVALVDRYLVRLVGEASHVER